MEKIRKIHFINRIDYCNVGDWNCSPLMVFWDFFRKYTIIRHDIDFVNFNEIERDDVVILGGGGIIDATASINATIDRIFELCDTVIGWGVGFNTHNQRWYQGSGFEEVDLARFAIIGIRDFNHPSGAEYLPCPSSLLFKSYVENGDCEIQRKVGYIGHKDMADKILFCKDALTNSENINRVAEYILSSEAVVTRSYHCAYWAMLLGRKAIVLNKFSTKFDYYKYCPEFVEIYEEDSDDDINQKINTAVNNANIYLGMYEEAVELNESFFERVSAIVIDRNITPAGDYQKLYEMNCQQAWNRQVQASKVRDEFKSDMTELHEDVYARLDMLQERARSIEETLENLTLSDFLKRRRHKSRQSLESNIK